MTKSTPFFVFIAIFLCQFACKSDDDLDLNSNIEFSNCLADEPLPEFTDSWCNDLSLDSTLYCEMISIDTPFRLNTESKGWLPFFCCEIGESIYYSNEKGDQTSLVVSEKGYYIQSTRRNIANHCEFDKEKKVIFCSKKELGFVKVVSDLFGLELEIKLSPYLNTSNLNAITTGTNVYILSKRDSNIHNGSFIDTHFNRIVESGNLPETFSSSEFYDEITILNRTFQDVYADSSTNSFSSSIPMLYNQEYGIISFIDKSGERWVINK